MGSVTDVKIEGVDELNKQFKKLKTEYGTGHVRNVTVSFGTNYGLYVHEDLEAYHPTGENKFLEKAVARNADRVAKAVERGIQSTNFGLALYHGGLLIQREAQKLTPVKSGNLRGSARTERERT